MNLKKNYFLIRYLYLSKTNSTIQINYFIEKRGNSSSVISLHVWQVWCFTFCKFQFLLYLNILNWVIPKYLCLNNRFFQEKRKEHEGNVKYHLCSSLARQEIHPEVQEQINKACKHCRKFIWGSYKYFAQASHKMVAAKNLQV